jgi:hypothetical protein
MLHCNIFAAVSSGVPDPYPLYFNNLPDSRLELRAAMLHLCCTKHRNINNKRRPAFTARPVEIMPT